ncbi:hypothetical protein SAMN05192534_11459 [Alteribacillus persepolensis]|uniref:Uncharacterized protein n=1 Tax=Alteribacillus persepolensis TaxID=568899 RepID=A0A1G8G6F4_9BACI|nr:DUF5327 family protein [Alteribacillus persepolensis]SDH89952.1 hypothetical protein SAMN05192534_11459 [Alteribacillus persepolensis]
MNIAAQTVVEKMEEELVQLAEQVEQQNNTAAQAHARVLKAYCDIILAAKGQENGQQNTQTAHVPVQKVQAASAKDMETSKKTAVRRSSAVQSDGDVPSASGNLLEF